MSCCHVVASLDICANKQLNTCTYVNVETVGIEAATQQNHYLDKAAWPFVELQSVTLHFPSCCLA